MYYSQSTKKITTIILSFDGVMTNLSKLRYNYYRRLCKLYNVQLNIDLYFKNCTSQSTMYQDCPIPANLIPVDALKAKVEEDLYTYCKHHGIKINEGFDELYELVKSKKLRLIYTSTHSKKYTDPLFNMSGAFYKPHQFSYDQPSIYETFKDNPSQVLVIASDKPTLQIANQYHYNVLYYPTIQVEDEEDQVRSLSVIHHLIEAINLVLDPSRQPRHQYLLNDYQQLMNSSISPTIKEILTSIYESETKKAEETPEIDSTEIVEEKNEVEEPINTGEDTINEIVEKESVESDSDNDSIQLPFIEASEDLFEKTMVFDFKLNEPEKKENPLDTIELDDSFTLEPFKEDTQTDIDTIIHDLNQKNLNNTSIFTKEELKEFGMNENDLYREDEDEEKTPFIQNLFGSLLYAIIDSIIFMIIYLAMSIGLYDWIYHENGFLSFIQPIFKAVYSTSMLLFGSVASSIGLLMNASATFVEGIAVFIFITVVFWIGLTISTIIKERKNP